MTAMKKLLGIGFSAAVGTAVAGVTINDVLNTQSGPGQPFDSFSLVAANASGLIAFTASNDGSAATTGSSLAKFDGTTITILATNPTSGTTNNDEFRVFEFIDMNDAGTVALRALYGGSSTSTRPRGIIAFDTSGTPTILVKDANGTNNPAGPFSASMGGVSINSSGSIVHAIEFDSTALGRELRLTPATGGASTVIANTISTTTVEGWTFAGGLTATQVLRDNGDVLFYANYDRSGGQITTAAQDSVYYYTAATGTIRTLLDDTDDVGHTGPYKQYTSIGGINADGVFAVQANNSDTGEQWIVVYDVDDNTFSNYVDNTGPYETISSRPRILDNGIVVFEATKDATGEGIYTGSDPVADKIIELGDTLLGGTIVSLVLADVAGNTVYFSYGIDTTGDGVFDHGGIASVDLGGAPPCPGDVNGDNTVNLTDLSTLLANFGVGSGATLAQGDLDDDGDVDLTDLSTLLALFGSTCA